MSMSSPLLRRHRLVLAVALLALLAAACGGGDDGAATSATSEDPSTSEVADPPDADEEEPMTVRYLQASDSLAYVTYFVAHGLDLFAEHGVVVDRQPNIGVASQAAQSVVTGDADLAAVGTTGAYAAMASGQPLHSIAVYAKQSILQLNLTEEAIARTGLSPDAPIEERVQALRGMTIAVPPEGSVSASQFRTVLEEYGVDADSELTLQPIEDATALAASAREGQTDGYFYSPPTSSLAIAEGWGRAWVSLASGEVPSLQGLYLIDLVAADQFLEANPEAAQRFIDALDEAAGIIAADPEQARGAVRESFPDMDDALFDAAFDSVLPAFQDGLAPTQDGFDLAFELWSASLDSPMELTYERAYDTQFVE